MSESINKNVFEALMFISKNICGIIKADLSTGIFEAVKSESGIFMPTYIEDIDFYEWLESFVSDGYIYEEDAAGFREKVKKEYVINYFENQKSDLRLRYRINNGDSYRWSVMTMMCAEDYSSENKNVWLTIYKSSEELSELYDKEEEMRSRLRYERISMDMLQDIVKAGIWRMPYDSKGNIRGVVWSHTFRKMLGFEDENDFPNTVEAWSERIHPDEKSRVMANCYRIVGDYKSLETYNEDYRIKTKGGEYRWYHATGKNVLNDDGSPYMYIGVLVDINDKKEREYHIKQEHIMRQHIQRQYAVLDSIADIYMTMHLIDIKENTVLELNNTEYLHRFMADYLGAKEQLRYIIKRVVMSDHIEKALDFTNLETLPERMKGKKLISEEFISVNVGWFRIQFIAVHCDDNDGVREVLLTSQSIEDEKRKVENLVRMSHTDELTMLFNRRSFEDEIDELKRKELSEDLVVLSIDINGLKNVNDNQGHVAGDELIKAAAHCILASFGNKGKCFRIGGDEFAVILNIDDREFEMITDFFREKVNNWSGSLVKSLAVSYGYAKLKDHRECNLSELLILADKEMYKDKSNYYIRNGFDRRRR